MTLEEAIKHAEEKAKCGGRCGEDHAQLAMWLKELQKLRAVETEKRNGKSTQNVSKEDLISRKAAIDAHYEYCNKHPDAGFPVWSLKILEDLPSAEPERKTGHWILHTEQEENIFGAKQIECSECGDKCLVQFVEKEKYCRNCGAYMGGEQDG